MTVKELIAELLKLNPDAEIGVLDTEWGTIDPVNIEETYLESDKKYGYYIRG